MDTPRHISLRKGAPILYTSSRRPSGAAASRPCAEYYFSLNTTSASSTSIKGAWRVCTVQYSKASAAGEHVATHCAAHKATSCSVTRRRTAHGYAATPRAARPAGSTLTSRAGRAIIATVTSATALRGGCDRADLAAQREPARGINTAAAEPSAPPTDARHRGGGAAADSEEVEQEEQEGQEADDEAEAEAAEEEGEGEGEAAADNRQAGRLRGVAGRAGDACGTRGAGAAQCTRPKAEGGVLCCRL